MEGLFTPFEFNVDVTSTPLDENDVSTYQWLTQVHMGDFFNIKIHVRNLIICLTREELQQPISTVPYFQSSSFETSMVLACPWFLERGLVSVVPPNIIPHVILHRLEPHVMAYARELCGSGGESSACRMFNLDIHITIEKLYDDVVNMIMEESAREVRTVPATKKAIESLKKVNIEKGMAKESCSICLEEYNGEEEEVLTMPCKHMYHQECIIQWLQRCDTCPLCRNSINQSSTT